MNSYDIYKFGLFDEYRQLLTQAVKENKEVVEIKINNIIASKCDDIGCHDRVELKITITHISRGGEIGRLLKTDQKTFSIWLDNGDIKNENLNTKWLFNQLKKYYKHLAWAAQAKLKYMEEGDYSTIVS